MCKSASSDPVLICQALSALPLQQRYIESTLTFYHSFFRVGKKTPHILPVHCQRAMSVTAAISNYTAAFSIVRAQTELKDNE